MKKKKIFLKENYYERKRSKFLGKQNDKTNFGIRKCSKIEHINISQSKDFFLELYI